MHCIVTQHCATVLCDNAVKEQWTMQLRSNHLLLSAAGPYVLLWFHADP